MKQPTKLFFLLLLWGIFSIMLTPLTLQAKEKTFGNLFAEYVRNYDGDTITVNIPKVHSLLGSNVRVRLRGVDTPEMRSKCKTKVGKTHEKTQSVLAKNFIKKILTGKTFVLKNVSRGKYFRIVANIEIEGFDLSKELIKQGLGVVYDGERKTKDWCIH